MWIEVTYVNVMVFNSVLLKFVDTKTQNNAIQEMYLFGNCNPRSIS